MSEGLRFLALFGIGLSTGLSGAMIPGPLMLYTVSEAFRTGRWAGVKIALGHLVLEAGFVTLVVFGCRQLLWSVAFRTMVAWVGGVGLVVMGGLILARLRSLSVVSEATLPCVWGPWVGGAVFSLASPGFVLWWATIGTAVFLQAALAGCAGVAAMATGHATADLVWGWLVAFSVERGRAYCTHRLYRWVMAAIAVTLIGLGCGLPIYHWL